MDTWPHGGIDSTFRLTGQPGRDQMNISEDQI